MNQFSSPFSLISQLAALINAPLFYFFIITYSGVAAPPPPLPKKAKSGVSYREFRRVALTQPVCDTSDFESAMVASIQHQQSGSSTSYYATAVERTLLPSGPW